LFIANPKGNPGGIFYSVAHEFIHVANITSHYFVANPGGIFYPVAHEFIHGYRCLGKLTPSGFPIKIKTQVHIQTADHI